ncbi:unnamed protein product [Ilex paraguariensis]|uniref:RNA-dependent RNA polymerase n=1 Tax=Ilex paraguariensis TaxID=185542 RepID=A0ABC8TMI0_9AQUA
MVNENLGTIWNVHVVHADLSEYRALDEKCIKLAELAATAVNFPKTGKNLGRAGDVEIVMLSIAWIAVDYLARIKIKCGGDGNADLTKPINAFATYVADLIRRRRIIKAV